MKTSPAIRILIKMTKRLFLFFCIILTVLPGRLMAAEPAEYLQSNDNAQAHAANPAGWVQSNLKTVTVPGDGNTWRLADSKVMVRAFTNPQYYNLTTKKFQNLYPSALWVTTGNELPDWYRNAANGVNAGNVALKTAQLHGLPTSTLAQYNAVVELWIDPNKLLRPTRDPNRMLQPTALPTQDFPAKPAYLSDAEYNKFKAWYVSNITASYNNPDPDKRYPWTQLGYTYYWGGDQSSLAGITGLSEFVILGTRAGFTSPLETFAVYSIQSYLYRTGADGDGAGNFNITGNCDTIWAGTKFQPSGNTIIISQGGVISGGEGIYLSSSGYTITNYGQILGPTAQKYFGDGPAGTSVYFYNGGTLINSASGVISGDNIAIGGRTAATVGVNVTNAGYLSGNLYAMQTGAADDSLTVESGGTVRGSVDLGTGTDHILFKNGSTYRPVIDRQGNTASILKAADVTIRNGSTVTPEFTGVGLIQSGTTYRIAQGAAVTGAFGTIVEQYPVFDFSLLPTGTDLSLRVTRIPYATAAGSADPNLTNFAQTLDKGLSTASGDMVTLLSEIDNQADSNSLASALRQLTPTMHSASTLAVFAIDRMRFSQLLAYNSTRQDISISTSNSPVMYAATLPATDATPEYNVSNKSPWEGFVLASGYRGSMDTIGNVPGYSYDALTSLFGIDKRFSGNTIAGLSLSSTHTYMSGNDYGNSSTQIKTLSPAIFVSTMLNRFRLDIMSAYSYNQYQNDRRVVFGSIYRTAKSDYNGHQFSGMVNLGYKINLAEKITLEPVGGFYLSYLRESGFTETRADAANLTVEPRRNWAIRSHIGPKLRQGLRFADINLDIEITALWLHNFNTTDDITARLSSLGDSASVNGISSDLDAAELRTKLSLYQVRDFTFSLEYVLTLSPHSRENSLQLGFKWLF